MTHTAYFPGFCIFVDNLQGTLYCGSTRPNITKTEPIPWEGCEPTVLTFEQQKTKESSDTLNELPLPHLRVTIFMPTDEILQLKH
jgi:hypothetical protein